MAKRRLIWVLTIILAITSCSKNHSDIDFYLDELDREIALRDIYEKAKQDRIQLMESALKATGNELNKWALTTQLFEEYQDYQYDSAYVYALKLLDFAKHSGRRNDMARAQIALLHCYKSVGFFNEAVDVIQDFDAKGVSESLCGEFYFLCAETFQNLSSFVEGSTELVDKYYNERLRYYDKVLQCSPYGSYFYGYARLEKELACRYSDSLAIRGRQDFIASSAWNDHQMAVQFSILSEAYNAMTLYDEAVIYRAKSAICDIQSCTHETTSAKILAGHMYARGQIDRAHRYIQQAQYDAEFFNSRLRKTEINSLLPVIENSRYNWLQNQRLWLAIVLGIIVLLLGISLALLLILRSRNKILAQTHKELAEKSKLLEDSNISLMLANERLREANEIKDQYIIQSLYGNTAFVNEVNEAVNEAARDIALKRPDDARTKLYHIGIKKERTRIAANFDTAFLKLFPNWLDDFNALFDKDMQFHLGEDGTLPMDVRIYALMRLGFNNAAEVAEYLNLSIDTVYVYKARLKAKALVDKDEFDSRIMSIPKP